MTDCNSFLRDLKSIRDTNPLLLNITNYVVTNNTANALLAIGASPIMTFAQEEAEDLVGISNALVVNIGTLNSADCAVMATAWQSANKKGIPVVFDPVGAGASRLRTETSLSFLNRYKPAIIRGNASEIMTLAGESGSAKGVDSSQSASSAITGAKALAQVYKCIVCVSGKEDLVTDGTTVYRIKGGHALMPYVTGLGCTATAICASFATVNTIFLEATVHAMAAVSMAGALAGEKVDGPGMFEMHMHNAFYSMGKSEAERLFDVAAI